MESLNTDIMILLDKYFPEDCLYEEINNACSLKLLHFLLRIKRWKIINGKSQRITYPIKRICERENEDLQLLCEVLKTALFATNDLESAIVDVITYLNSQLEISNFSTRSEIKTAWLLNEIISVCKSLADNGIFEECMSLQHLDKFLLQILKEQNKTKTYVLSTVLPNYISIISDELHHLNLLHDIFLHCKITFNLDVLCTIYNYTNKQALLTNSKSLLVLDDFWQHIESCISCDNTNQQKRAIFLLKKLIVLFNDDTSPKLEIAYLQVTNSSFEDVWQNYFILLDAAKEKQLHLVLPSLTLLNSLKHLHIIWQESVYKKLLEHTQSTVVYFVASHILQERMLCTSMNKYFLSAINRNEYTYHSIKVFTKFLYFCNDLNSADFISLLKDILEITWTPTAAWCLFANMFSGNLTKSIPFTVAENLYTLLTNLPDVYIRTGCISVFLNYFVNRFHWKLKFEDSLKLLLILKEHDNDLFVTTISRHIDIEYLDTVLHTVEGGTLSLKTFEIFVQMLKILKYESGLFILDNMANTNSNFYLILYANFQEKYRLTDIQEFTLERLTEVHEDYMGIYLSIIKKLMKYNDFSKLLYSKIIDVLHNISIHNKTTIYVASYIAINFYYETADMHDIRKCLRHVLEGKTDDILYGLFIKLYFLYEENPDVSFLEQVLHNQNDIIISEMFKCLSTINFQERHINIIHFLKQVLPVLSHMSKSKHFKSIILNYINCIFSLTFLETLCNLGMTDLITLVADTLLSLSDAYPIINYYFAEKIKNTVLLNYSRDYTYLLIPIIKELILKGFIIKKDDKVHYYICQEIYVKLRNASENPNIIEIGTRMSSVESMLLIIVHYPEYADSFAFGLMEKYKIHAGKRYFPDSQIHLQKLRIIQALLIIHPFIDEQRQPLINLITECFCTEIHQPCVKQLMQWLLFSLLKDQDSNCLNLIKTKIDSTSKTRPSSIIAFIVVLLHLTLYKEEFYWFSAIEMLIPWCMGAHFKLRVYSQAAVRKLLEDSKQRKYTEFLNKYGYLEKSILSVIEASGQSFYDTLKSDEFIFTVFTPQRDYSFETIYVDIPRLNHVTKMEWENILQHKFMKHKTMDVLNKDRTFAESVTVNTRNSNKAMAASDDVFGNNYTIIQRKINPCQIVDEQENSKSVSDLILIASLVDKSSNLGGLSRTCEVFGVRDFVLNDIKILDDKDFKSLSMSSEGWVHTVEVKINKLREYILEVRNKGYFIIGAEQTSRSISLHKYKFNKKTALVLGNEKEGIPADIIPLLDECIEIPQFGMVRSLNVHVAGATFLWEYVKQHMVE